MPDAPRQGESAEIIHLPGSKGPARGYTWEPFKAGHFKSKKHGAYSDRIIVPLAADIANDLMAELPYLQDTTYREALLDYARTAARVEVLEKWLDEHGEIREDGTVAPAAIYLVRVRGHLASMASRLGLDPLSRAKLGKDTTATKLDLAQLMSALNKQNGGTA
ncbi:hypothetical protein [Rhodococcus sp. BS-15]|uniref:hypothetical protein n=1 Tax=Rhodococcus sp. BS-15 TaxID=1304954 RepID=UPI000B1220AC|nr:hypothetical protein [Rhodococcus sp. BS-15]